jgi:glycosyltransferase involved in cell wall biosynthesis
LTWELLVVNNNCTDDTDLIVTKYATMLPLRLLHEPKQGLSNARNCAITHARGDLLIWTDDDVLVEPTWLVEYLNVADQYPQAAYFGGTVDPWFAVEPPMWIQRNLDLLQGPFAIRQLGPEVRPFAESEMPFGANMAFRTALIRTLQFDPTLGRIGSHMLSGEETELVKQLRSLGYTGFWVGPARVQHYVAPERMTADYVWKFFHGLGRTKQRLVPHERDVPMLLRAPRWVVREYLVERFKSLIYAVNRSPAWLRSLTRAAVARGIIDECRARRQGA